MTKTRFSISVEAELAEQIKAAAARAGQDVSTYMWRATMDVVHRDARIADIFAEVDAEIAAVEQAASELDWPPPPADGELPEAERAAIEARWKAFFSGEERGVA